MIDEGKIVLPLLSKWTCIYSRKGGARYLDMIEVFADGSLNKFPSGSINLDTPIVLLNPDHDKANPTRPSNIAMACDLFHDPTCYHFLRFVEEHIHQYRVFEPVDAIMYFIGQFDSQLKPSGVYPCDYGLAIEQLEAVQKGALERHCKPT